MMSRFAPALRRTARELDLPPPARAALILEMASDLEALYEHHRAQGAGDDEATRLAEEAVLGSPEVIRRLGRIHRGSWRGWSLWVGSRLGGGADLALLAVAVVPMLAMACYAAALVLTVPFNPLIWPLLLLGAVMVGIILLESGRVIGGGRGGAGRLPILLLLSAAAPALGALILAGGLHSVLLALGRGADAATRLALLTRVGGDAAALAVGLLLGIAGMIAWFVLSSRVSAVAQREVERLLQDDLPSPDEGPKDVITLASRRRA